jgi:hypothetical protein
LEELVLMSWTGDELIAFDDRRSPGHNFYDSFSYLDHGDGDIEGLRIVDVTVIDKDTQFVLSRKFKVGRDDDKFFLVAL